MDRAERATALGILLEEGLIRAGGLLGMAPQALTSPSLEGRIRGMLMGVAIGDALGATSESLNPGDRRASHGEIRDYQPNRYADWRAVGLPSDDSQLTFRLVEQLLEDGDLDGDRLLQRFAGRQIFGIGRNTRAALRAYQEGGFDWHTVGTPDGAGNGALMRIAPVVLPYLRAPSPDLWADAALATVVTHRSALAAVTSVAWVALLWDLLALGEAPARSWWADRFLEHVRAVEPQGLEFTPRGGEWAAFRGSLGDWVERCREEFLRSADVAESGRLWHSGAYVPETIASVLHVLTQFGDNPEEAIVRAVNDTRDNDTVAAIVGAAVGALHGLDALPKRWIEGLLGRLNEDDDGRLFSLVDQAVDRFVGSGSQARTPL